MRPPSGMVVDHIDGNPLNNTRSNLQITTNARNNMRAKKNGGVTRMFNSDRWRARLRVDGEMFSLGCYNTEEEAREAVERARRIAWEDMDINLLGTVL